MSDLENNEVVCREGDTFLPDPDDPATFYQCVDGIPMRQRCPEGMVFDPAIKPGPVCVHPQNLTPKK
jgi:hypothetical protein